jgi:hypothetical protein
MMPGPYSASRSERSCPRSPTSPLIGHKVREPELPRVAVVAPALSGLSNHQREPHERSECQRLRNSQRVGFPEKAARVEEGRQVLAVGVAGEPGLSPLGRVDLGVVPLQCPGGGCPATLGRASHGIARHGTSVPRARADKVQRATTGEVARCEANVNEEFVSRASPTRCPMCPIGSQSDHR